MVRSRGIVMVALLAAALAGCANPADDKAEATVRDAEPAAEPMAAAQGAEFTLTEASKVEFTGSKVTGSHDGGFEEFTGSITVVDGDPTASRVEVTIDTNSLWADNERLTGHLKSPDFFEVETYPTATFRSTDIVATGDGFEVTGDLNLHGVTKSITFPAQIAVEPDRVSAQAEFVVKRFQFGIEYPGKADDLIRDEVVIRLDLEAVPAGA